MHLPERNTIIERMASWLKPGGWMVLEDMFVRPEMFLPDVLSRLWAGVREVTAARVGTDCMWALTQPEPMRSAGLVEAGARVEIPPTFPRAGTRGGSEMPPVLEFTLRSLEQLAPAMAEHNLFTEQDADAMVELINTRDPSILSYGLGMVSAWGRKPAATLAGDLP
jgi:hypothetical protein